MTGRAILWEAIAADLRRGIADGTWQPGTLLPSMSVLCATYKVSDTPVRRAIDALVADGLAVAEHGRGVRVLAEPATTDPGLADRVAELERQLAEHVADGHHA